MKKWSIRASCAALCVALFATYKPLHGAEPHSQIGVCDFTQCVMQSKMGKLEQERLETVKTQMQKSVSDLESQLTETQKKLQDKDLMDTLSPKAEEELRHKYRLLQEESQRMQAQFYQMLQQAQMNLMQKMNQYVRDASSAVADQLSYHFVLSADAAYHFSKNDITKEVIQELDKRFDEEQKTLPQMGLPSGE